MKRLFRAIDLIKRKLEQSTLSRESDDILFAKLITQQARAKHDPDADAIEYVVDKIFVHRKVNGYLSYESISRTRRYLQRKYPYLRPEKEVYDGRHERAQKIHDGIKKLNEKEKMNNEKL